MKRVRISRRTVDALNPRDTKFYAWDTIIAGFGVKVLASGRKIFVFKYRTGGGRSGKSREPVIGHDGTITPDQARKVAQKWAAQVALGQDPSADRRAQNTAPKMVELFTRYLTDHADKHKKPRSAQEDRAMIDKVLTPAFGKIRVKDISRADIARWHTKLSKTPYRANRALACLSKALNLAEIWGMRPINSNPCKGVTKFKEEKRKRYLSSTEYAKLFGTLEKAEAGEVKTESGSPLSPFACAAIRVLILTGARRSEILSLEWSWVKLNDGVADLPDSKGGARRLYLEPGVVAVLASLPRLHDAPFVFPGAKSEAPLKDLKRPWDTIRKAAGLHDLRLHDLRHSYASVGAASGMSLPQIGALLGHKSSQTTARYAHLADEVQHRSAALIGAHLAEQLKPSA
ncbi:MAG: tyrosine-type recombinase/integrase [Paracoccaceae bacterium]|nr:tyrosine-type recombinase/integrase [Paracoccaceae bacterium]